MVPRPICRSSQRRLADQANIANAAKMRVNIATADRLIVQVFYRVVPDRVKPRPLRMACPRDQAHLAARPESM